MNGPEEDKRRVADASGSDNSQSFWTQQKSGQSLSCARVYQSAKGIKLYWRGLEIPWENGWLDGIELTLGLRNSKVMTLAIMSSPFSEAAERRGRKAKTEWQQF
jgi:hypothetical protein